MTLNEWHHRPGGKWRVDWLGTSWRYRYAWIARAGEGHELGEAPFAWLARRRAIAAMDRMRAGNDDKGGR